MIEWNLIFCKFGKYSLEQQNDTSQLTKDVTIEEADEESPAIYLIDISCESLEKSTEIDNVNQGILNKIQEKFVDWLFITNKDVFVENISEEGQPMELT